MEDMEKELGSLLDKFNEKRDEFTRERDDKEKRTSEFKDEFKDFASNKIKPIMIEYKKLLERKNVGCDIIEKSGVQYEKGSHSSISLRVNYNTDVSRSASKPEIEFYPKEESIIVYEKKFQPSGSGSEGVEGSYDKATVTEDFIKMKIENFLKATFSKQWTKYDFY